MAIQVMSEGQIVREASDVLLQHLSPAKVIRFWASWQMGHDDYLRWRDEYFGQETVASLYEKVVEFQEE